MASTSEPLPAAAVRGAEQLTMLHTPEAELMDRAAAAVAAAAHGSAHVALLVGRGNNGGDALLAGALLAAQGCHVTAVLLGPDAHPRGLARLGAAGGRVVSWGLDEPVAATAIAGADTVIDGIAGLGSRGGLPPDAVAAVAHLTPGTRVISVDLPSGLDPDSGAADKPHVTADVTVTFTAPKACLTLQPAAASAGRVVIADVGVDL